MCQTPKLIICPVCQGSEKDELGNQCDPCAGSGLVSEQSEVYEEYYITVDKEANQVD